MKLLAGIGISVATAAPEGVAGKTIRAAKDFEALLVSQLLRSMRGDGSWFGAAEDSDGGSVGGSADDTALGLAEQELAKALSAGGGLGLARMIAAGLPPDA